MAVLACESPQFLCCTHVIQCNEHCAIRTRCCNTTVVLRCTRPSQEHADKNWPDQENTTHSSASTPVMAGETKWKSCVPAVKDTRTLHSLPATPGCEGTGHPQLSLLWALVTFQAIQVTQRQWWSGFIEDLPGVITFIV